MLSVKIIQDLTMLKQLTQNLLGYIHIPSVFGPFSNIRDSP